MYCSIQGWTQVVTICDPALTRDKGRKQKVVSERNLMQKRWACATSQIVPLYILLGLSMLGLTKTYLLLDAGLESDELFLAHVALDILVIGCDALTVDACLSKTRA